MKNYILKLTKKLGCLALAAAIAAVSSAVGGAFSVSADTCSHSYAYQIYFDNATSGHIQTCTKCGETTGKVEAHTIDRNSLTGSSDVYCELCNYRILCGAQGYSYRSGNDYFFEAIEGERLSNGEYTEKYWNNFFGNEIHDKSDSNVTNNPNGMTSYVIGKDNGVFTQFADLAGSGSESDPYIIDDAITLYKVLASGGTNFSAPLHFKLACDITLKSAQWVDLTERLVSSSYVAYTYLAFNGTLDGDGHTVTGLYSNTADIAAGFVPVLGKTGVIKNLHFKNANVTTSNANGTAGVIAGIAKNGSEITNCSVENSGSLALVGKDYGSIKNSYVINAGGSSTYYNGEGNIVSASSIDTSANNGVWYKSYNTTPRLLSRADALGFADVDGDGVATGYSAADITALKNHLLWKDGYDDVYGDVDSNGKTDITDLAIMQRVIVNDYADISDGFWRNIELKKFGIYYTDNDNYDFARKLELYFKNNIGVAVAKKKATAPPQYAIVLKKDASLGVDYTVTYDEQNALLTFTGKNFTAVEQAVLDFIQNSDYKTSTVFETSNGTLSADKAPVSVDTNGDGTKDTSYYYAWGDEFETGSTVNGNTTVDYGKWEVRDMGSDDKTDGEYTGLYRNMKFADNNGLAELNVVKNGKLTMHRGVGYGAQHVGENTGNLSTTGKPVTFDSNDIATSGVLYTRQSMLFKRGYAEMKCTLPTDGFAFPAWWLMTNAGNNNPEVSRSLYSKVYYTNEDYDYTLYYTPENYKTYKYKLPGATYEIDIFEIIQQPTVNNSGNLQKSSNNLFQYTIHKWYTHSKTVKGNNRPLKVYDLDWENLDKSVGFTQILGAEYKNGKYEETYNIGGFYYHKNNLSDGTVNVNIKSDGNKTSKYGAKYFGNYKYQESTLDEKYTLSSGQTQISATFGFLWDEEQMTVFITKDGSTETTVHRADISDFNFDGMGYDPEQYAYMIIENHFYTNESGKKANASSITSSIKDCTMEIEYVRLYQLDGKRDIVTPETEAFNNPVNRFN